jgi:hypothetical protein
MPKPAAIEASDPPPVLPPLSARPRPAAIPWARAKSFSDAFVFSSGGVVPVTETLIRAPRRVGADSRRIFRTRSRSVAFQNRMSRTAQALSGTTFAFSPPPMSPTLTVVSRVLSRLSRVIWVASSSMALTPFSGVPPWADGL